MEEDVMRIGAPPVDELRAAKPPKRRKGLVIGLALAAAGAILAGAGTLTWVLLDKTPVGEVAAQAVESPLVAAKRHCARTSEYAEIGDDGNTLTLHGAGKKDGTGLSYRDLQCFLIELQATDAIRAEIDGTRALDGRQNGDWGDYHASWTYHPDNGFQLIITIK